MVSRPRLAPLPRPGPPQSSDAGGRPPVIKLVSADLEIDGSRRAARSTLSIAAAELRLFAPAPRTRLTASRRRSPLRHSMATSLRVASAVPTSCGAHAFIGKGAVSGEIRSRCRRGSSAGTERFGRFAIATARFNPKAMMATGAGQEQRLPRRTPPGVRGRRRIARTR
jgi:hypothetical protein